MTRILIVEDEPNMVAGLRDNFEFEGYDVITAPDGVAGLERALKEAPDLVILDVMMPRMSGLDVCKQLKAKRPSVPIIMLTARGQEVDKVVGLELGADDYVTKPFSIRELLARVKAVLRRAKTVPEGAGALFLRRGRSESEKLPGFAQRQGDGFFVQGIRAAEIFSVPSRRDSEPRPAARGCVGLRPLSHHAYRGRAHCPLASEG